MVYCSRCGWFYCECTEEDKKLTPQPKPPDKVIVTPRRLKKMCKYFKNKKVLITYEYNNSLGEHDERSWKGRYNSFEVTTSEFNSYHDVYYKVKFIKNGQVVFEQEFFSGCAEFTGLGMIKELNSGPYRYFRIERKLI